MGKLLKKHLKWFIGRIERDRLDSTAAHSSFFLIISFLPFLALLLTLMQRIHFESGLSVIETALEALPESISSYVKELFPSPLESTGVLPVAIIAAVWSSSVGMVAIIKGLDHIYDVKETRNYIHLRLIALLYVVALAVVLLITVALMVFGNTIYRSILDRFPFFAILLVNFKSLVSFVILLLFFTLMYSFLPRRRVRFVNNFFGAAFGALGWVLFSYFFSLFVENFSNFSIYGGLATLVILMYWLFFCMYILFLGAEVSIWLETSSIREDIKNLKKKRSHKRTRRKAEKEREENS